MSTPGVDGIVTGVASRLRFPYLLLITALLFVIDLFVIDPIPFLDEILLALGTLILATWRTKSERRAPRSPAPGGDGPVVDVPPSEER